jgi:hypothetical protein
MRRGKAQRFRHGHWSRLQPRTEWGDHLWEERDCGFDTLCHVWIGALNSNGYGQFSRSSSAHRLRYEAEIGPIAEGMEIDHLCRNRACVNPDHLEVVTRAQNQQRGAHAKLTWEKVKWIRDSPAPTTQIARELGISATTVSKVRRHLSWLQ